MIRDCCKRVGRKTNELSAGLWGCSGERGGGAVMGGVKRGCAHLRDAPPLLSLLISVADGSLDKLLGETEASPCTLCGTCCRGGGIGGDSLIDGVCRQVSETSVKSKCPFFLCFHRNTSLWKHEKCVQTCPCNVFNVLLFVYPKDSRHSVVLPIRS